MFAAAGSRICARRIVREPCAKAAWILRATFAGSLRFSRDSNAVQSWSLQKVIPDQVLYLRWKRQGLRVRIFRVGDVRVRRVAPRERRNPMDSFNVVAGVCSVLSFLMAAADWVRRRRKTKGNAKAKK